MKLTRIDLYLGGVGVEADTPFCLKKFKQIYDIT